MKPGIGKWFASCARCASHLVRMGLTEVVPFPSAHSVAAPAQLSVWLYSPHPFILMSTKLPPAACLLLPCLPRPCACLSVSKWPLLLAFLLSLLASQPLVPRAFLESPSILLEDLCRGYAWSEHGHTLLAEDREIVMYRANTGTRLLPLLVSLP